MKRLIVALVVLLIGCWTTASAQSLAELAKKEKERRKTLDAAKAKSFDDYDLRSSSNPLPSSMPSTEEGAESAEGEAEPEEQAEEEDPTTTQAYWRDRMAPIDKRIADIQAQLNSPGFEQDPNNMLRKNRLERDLAQAQADRQALLDEARRKSVPPGWLR